VEIEEDIFVIVNRLYAVAVVLVLVGFFNVALAEESRAMVPARFGDDQN